MHSTSSIGQAFIVHGEAEHARAQAQVLEEFCYEPAIIPEPHVAYEV